MQLHHYPVRPAQSAVEVSLILGLVAAIAVAGLSLTGTSLGAAFCGAAEAFGANCGALLDEDFANLNAWQRVSGNWAIRDSELCGGPGEGRIFTPVSADDYVIDINKALLSKGDGYGVFFRTQNVERVSGYVFQYDPGYLDQFLIRKWVNGVEIERPIVRKRIPGYNWHNVNRQIQLSVIGDRFTVLVDGQPMLSLSDATYPSGGVGLRVWDGTDACFDNLTIRRP